jgi:hypothetical protein
VGSTFEKSPTTLAEPIAWSTSRRFIARPLINQLAAGFSTSSMTMAATTPNAVSLGWQTVAALFQIMRPASIGYLPFPRGLPWCM